MLTGKVKHFNSEKGFGFIENGEGSDIFVHESSLKNCKFLKKGVTVRFVVSSTTKGLEATSVELVRESNQPFQHQRYSTPFNDHRRY